MLNTAYETHASGSRKSLLLHMLEDANFMEPWSNARLLQLK